MEEYCTYFPLGRAFHSSYVLLPRFLVVFTRHILLYSSDCRSMLSALTLWPVDGGLRRSVWLSDGKGS